MTSPPLPWRIAGRTATALVLAAAGLAQAGTASVTFVDPANFRDASRSRQLPDTGEHEALRADIERHLQKLARQRLPADQQLRVDVLDLDLAGDFEPWRARGQDLRIVREISGPRMTVRYTLSSGDRVITPQREEKLADLTFLSGHNRYASGDRLRYEKAMLDHWFDQRFGGR